MRSTQPESGAAIFETVTPSIATVKVSAGVAVVVGQTDGRHRDALPMPFLAQMVKGERREDDLWVAAVEDSATRGRRGPLNWRRTGLA